MSAYARIRRRQLLQEAEGYLELTLLFADLWDIDPAIRDGLAMRALATLDLLERTDRESARALFLRGQAYRVVQRYKDAVAPLVKASRLDPDNVQINLALGWCYKRLNRLDLAIETLEDALEKDSEQGIIHYNLACYWSLARNVGLTLAYLTQAFELDERFRDLVADEPDFDPVRNHPEFLALTSVVV